MGGMMSNALSLRWITIKMLMVLRLLILPVDYNVEHMCGHRCTIVLLVQRDCLTNSQWRLIGPDTVVTLRSVMDKISPEMKVYYLHNMGQYKGLETVTSAGQSHVGDLPSCSFHCNNGNISIHDRAVTELIVLGIPYETLSVFMGSRRQMSVIGLADWPP